MSQQQLLIPSKIKVGYNQRNDTYTGQLAYVIYYDGKGVLRKEKSWNSWRDKKLGEHEFENTPIEGFVLNKGVGGNKHSYGWHTRNEKIRVYDPRNFEFEISLENLLFILRECNCSKGKGLEGKFVYAWDGTELALLPEACEDFQHSQKFTQLQDQKVSSKELIPGASYTTKKQKVLTFVGRFDYHFIDYVDSYRRRSKAPTTGVCKKYVFWDGKNFNYFNDLKNIATLNSDQIHQDYAKLVTKYANSAVGSKPVSFTIKSVPAKESGDNAYYNYNYFYIADPSEEGVFIQCRREHNNNLRKYDYEKNCYVNNDKFYVQTLCKYQFVNGLVTKSSYHMKSYPKGEAPVMPTDSWNRNYWAKEQESILNYEIPLSEDRLYAKLESGKEYLVTELQEAAN